MLRREAPWVAYEVEREERFWKAERPTPRRADIALLLKVTAGEAGKSRQVDRSHRAENALNCLA